MKRILQNAEEFAEFTAIMRAVGARSYLEIGSRIGGSLAPAARALPVGSVVTAVDLPMHPDHSRELQGVVGQLSGEGYHMTLILGDSTGEGVIEAAMKLAPYDVVFIDGNHSFDYVRRDFRNYGMKAAKLCAFHDISWQPRPGATPIEVPQFWGEIKGGYKHREIRLEEKDNGIGVLYI